MRVLVLPWSLSGVAYLAPDGEGAGGAAPGANAAAAATAAATNAGTPPPAGGAGTPPPAGGAGTQPPPAARQDLPGWMGQLSENRRTALANHGFASVDAMADRFLQLEGEAGRDRLLIPGENATPEQLTAWRKGIGVPDNADGYKLPTENIDAGFVKWARETAHKHGLPAAAFQAFAADWQGYVAEWGKQQETAATAAAREDDGKLRAEWKGDYDKNMSLVKRLGTYLGWADGTVGAIAGAEGYSKGYNGLLKLANLLAEDGANPAGAGAFTVTTAQEAEAEIARMQADPAVGKALTDTSHPQHKTVSERWDRLQEIRAGIRMPARQGAR